MKLLFSLLILLLPLILFAQNLEVEGKVKITEMDKVDNADSIVVKLSAEALQIYLIIKAS